VVSLTVNLALALTVALTDKLAVSDAARALAARQIVDKNTITAKFNFFIADPPKKLVDDNHFTDLFNLMLFSFDLFNQLIADVFNSPQK